MYYLKLIWLPEFEGVAIDKGRKWLMIWYSSKNTGYAIVMLGADA